jgi:hypothetical protein
MYPDVIDTANSSGYKSTSIRRHELTATSSISCAAFDGHRLLAHGTRLEAALALKRALGEGVAGPLLVFDDETGAVVDFDLSGSDAEIASRLAEPEAPPRSRGRPKLGVVAREVTLLPRHWEWLAAQPGGASVALRRLVDRARREDGGATQARQALDAAYRFLQAIAGDLPGFEEAARALFASDREGFARRVADWPADIVTHASLLLTNGAAATPGAR